MIRNCIKHGKGGDPTDLSLSLQELSKSKMERGTLENSDGSIDIMYDKYFGGSLHSCSNYCYNSLTEKYGLNLLLCFNLG